MSVLSPPLDWARIRLVVFDLAGTLYGQRRLRARILPRLAAAALRDPGLLRLITALRRVREAMAEAEQEGFVVELITRAAREAQVPEARAREVALHWLETRPLPHLASCRVPRGGLTARRPARDGPRHGGALGLSRGGQGGGTGVDGGSGAVGP